MSEAASTPSRLRTGIAVALVVLLAVGAGLGAAFAMSQKQDAFASTAVLLIDQEPGLTLSPNDGLISKLVRLRVKYVDTVQTTTFSDAVAATVGLSSGRVHTALSAGATPSSLLIRVNATDREPDIARRVAQTAAETLRDRLVIEQTALGIKPGSRVTLTVVTPAREGVRTSPSPGRVRLVGLVVGAGALLAGLVVLDVLRRRRQG